MKAHNIIIVILHFLVVISVITIINDKNKEVQEVQIESVTDTLSFKDSVYMYILSLNIQHADIVLKQALYETGHFTSKICKENNNLFGMKVAKQRPTTATGEQYNHAKYDSWQQSVIDYAIWQTKYCHNLTENEYLQYLQRVYSTNKKYVSILKHIKK